MACLSMNHSHPIFSAHNDPTSFGGCADGGIFLTQKRKSSLPFILDDSYEALREEFLIVGNEEK